MTESEQQRVKDMNLSAQEIAAQNETRNGVDPLYVDENGNVKAGDNSKNAGAYINEGSTVTPSNGKPASEQDRKKFNDWVEKEHPVDATGNRITPLLKNQALSSQAAQAYNAAHKSDYHGLNGSVSAVGKTMAQTLATGAASNPKVLSTLNETAKASPLSAKEALFNPNSADFTTNNPALATSLAKAAFGEDAAKVITGKDGWEINSLAAKSTGEGGRGLTIGMSKQNADGTVETASYDVLNNNAMTGDAKQYSDAQMFAEGLSGRMKSATLEGTDGVSEKVMIRHNKDGDEGVAAGAGVDPNQFNNADAFEVDEGIAGAALGVTAAAAFDQNNGFAENADAVTDTNMDQDAEPELQDINTLMAEDGNVYLAHSDNEGSYITADNTNGNNADDAVSNFITENADRMDDSAAAIAADTIRDNPEIAEQVAWDLNDGANEEIGNAALKAGFGDVIKPDDELSNFKYETTDNGGHIISADRISTNGSKEKIQICDAAAMQGNSDTSGYNGFRTSINDNAAFIKRTPDYSMNTSASANGELPATARQNGLSFNGSLSDSNTKLVGSPNEVGKFVAQNANYGGTTAQNGDAGNCNVNSQVNNAMVNAVKNSPEAARSAISSLNDKVDNNSALTSAMFNGAAHGTQYAGQNIQIGSMTPVTNAKGEHGVIATEKLANGQNGRQFAVFATKSGGVSISDGANYNSKGIDSSLHPKTNSNGTFEPTQAQTSKGVAMEVNGGAISGRQTLTAEQAKNYNNAVAEYNKGATASQRIPKIAENGTGIASNEGAAVYNKANSRMVSTSGTSEPIAAGQTLTEAQARDYNRAVDEYNKGDHKIDRIAENGTGIASQAGADIYNKANSQAISGSSVSNPIAAGQTLTAEQAKSYNAAVDEYNKGHQNIPRIPVNGTGVATEAGAAVYNKANEGTIAQANNAIKQSAVELAASPNISADNAKLVANTISSNKTVASGMWADADVAQNAWGNLQGNNAKANSNVISSAMFSSAEKDSGVATAMFNSAAEGSQFARQNIQIGSVAKVSNVRGQNGYVATEQMADGSTGRQFQIFSDGNGSTTVKQDFGDAPRVNLDGTSTMSAVAASSGLTAQIPGGAFVPNETVSGERAKTYNQAVDDFNATVPDNQRISTIPEGGSGAVSPRVSAFYNKANSYISGPEDSVNSAVGQYVVSQGRNGTITQGQILTAEQAKSYNAAIEGYNAGVPEINRIQKAPEDGTGIASGMGAKLYNAGNDNPDIVANTIRNSTGASNAAWQAVQDNGVAVKNPQIATAMVQQASGNNSAYANTTFESITPTQNGFIAKGYDSASNKPVEYQISGLNRGEFSDSGAVFTKNYGSLSRNADGSVHLSQAAQDDGMYISGAEKSAVINGKRRESVVITDPDGGLYRDLAGYFEDSGYVVRRFDLTNLQKSDGWDCLKSITPENAELDAQLFAQVVISNTMDDTTSIYATGPMSLLKALILRVFLDPEIPPEKKNIGEVYAMLQNPLGEEFLDKLFDDDSLCDELKPCLGPYLSFKQGSPNLRGNLITNLSVQLQLLQNKLVCKVLSTDDIDLLLPGQQPCAYFCLFPDSHDTFKFIVSLFFSCLFTNLIAYADQKCGGALPVPVNFLLDEFPSIGHLPDWDKKLAVVRKRNMSIVMIFQNITQLVNLYETAWQTIFSNCATWVALGINDEETAKLFSSRIGETSVEASTKKSSRLQHYLLRTLLENIAKVKVNAVF